MYINHINTIINISLSIARRTSALPEVENFAIKLENEHWNYGECDNDIVIVYSAGDNVVRKLMHIIILQ